MSTKVEVNTGGQGGKFLKVLIILILLLGGISTWLYSTNKRLKANNKELKIENIAFSQNIYTLTTDMEKYKIKLNDTIFYVNKIQALTVKVEDWKTLYKKEVDLVKKMKIKPSEVTSITQVTSSTKDTVYVPIYLNAAKKDSASLVSKWINITYEKIQNEQGKFTYEKKDCFDIVQVYNQKKFLIFKIKKKSKDEVYLLSHDPKSTILGITHKKIIK